MSFAQWWVLDLTLEPLVRVPTRQMRREGDVLLVLDDFSADNVGGNFPTSVRPALSSAGDILHERRSSSPCANTHLGPNKQEPRFPFQFRQGTVLYLLSK